jgi:SAM-dependent methyltransferase
MPRGDVYTHGHHDSVLRSHRTRTAENSAAYLLPELRPGLELLDIGCGPGTLTCDLAARVAPGRVLGIDREAGVLAEARAEARARNVEVEFRAGDAYALDLPAARFDVVHAHQLLQHLSDPVAALREWARVLRPGGLLAARDGDYATFTWYPDDPRLDRWLALYRRAARANGAEPDAGRRLLSWAQSAGLADAASSASVWCYATPETRAWWAGLWAERITSSALAEQIERAGWASRAELVEIADAWRAWALARDAWFALVHGEILWRKPTGAA